MARYSSSRLISLLVVLLHPFLAAASQVVVRSACHHNKSGSGASAFRIVLFADLHFGENAWTDWGPRQDVNSLAAMSAILRSENPDFVVYLGDVITANNMVIANASLYWDQAISPTRARGIPWATVFGNHDDAAFEWPQEWFSENGMPPVRCPFVSCSEEARCSFKGTQRIQLVEGEIARNKLSYSKSGPTELWPSISNYVLRVSSPKNPETDVVLLYFLDSGGGSYPEIISYAQTKWLQQKSTEMNPDSSLPELIFWHIPSEAYSEVAPGSEIQAPCVGSINDEKVQFQKQEMGMMEFLVSRPSVKGTIMDWIGVALTRQFGYVSLGTLATVDTGTGQEDPE
uniref:Calcineurin-like phosphoesterase domain-containing protein n=1 Tax=Kalanchoe fedtschenkoi TaxID=63787 RepID=A0A7N0VDG1_KALFE